jgi:hypothetical protein
MIEPRPAPGASLPARNETVRVGIVFERRRIAHPWQEWRWQPVAAIAGAAAVTEPLLLRAGEDWATFHLATLDLELFPGETADYRLNLSQRQPLVYVLWRTEAGVSEDAPEVFHVTVCHSEIQDYLDGGDVMADGVAMPAAIEALLSAYVSAHHVDVPFKKRKRTPMGAAGRDDENG